ncbi:MAG: hypothetical protein U1D28_01405 [Burkholderiales bacterium]|nr:hypothetical protein [Burkholderiales bacterium]
MHLQKRFSDQELEQIVEEATIYMCACPGQVAVQLRSLRELHRYQSKCEIEPGNDREVHRTIGEATMRAHVLMEAVCSGTPVLASRIAGNVGMLGADYAGYFEPGNAAQLATLLREARATQTQPSGLLAQLAAQCALRAPLFAPTAEQQALLNLVQSLHHPH